MKAALRAFGDMSIKVKFISAIRPFTLEPTEDGVQFIQLITPVRTKLTKIFKDIENLIEKN